MNPHHDTRRRVSRKVARARRRIARGHYENPLVIALTVERLAAALGIGKPQREN